MKPKLGDKIVTCESKRTTVAIQYLKELNGSEFVNTHVSVAAGNGFMHFAIITTMACKHMQPS